MKAIKKEQLIGFLNLLFKSKFLTLELKEDVDVLFFQLKVLTKNFILQNKDEIQNQISYHLFDILKVKNFEYHISINSFNVLSFEINTKAL